MVTNNVLLQAALRLPEDDKPWRVGFTATKKIGKAHIRNRSKRRLRAAMHEIFPELATTRADYVLICRFSTFYCPYKNLLKDLRYAVKRVNRMLLPDENEKNTNSDC